MKPPSEALLHITSIIQAQGSIFHEIPQDHEEGIAGYIELFHSGETTEKFIAAQIISAEPAPAQDNPEFAIDIDEPQLHHLVPTILIGYSPSLKTAAWTSVPSDLDRESNDEETPITLRIPSSNTFTPKSLDNEISVIAHLEPEKNLLIRTLDACLTSDTNHQLAALTLLSIHPDSKNSRVLLLACRSLLFNEDPDLADTAIRILARHAGRFRWAWNPDNQTEIDLMRYAAELCRNFTADECRQLVERVDEEPFGHADDLGEQVFDLLVRAAHSQKVLEQIAADKQQPLARRSNALFMTYCCNDAQLLAAPELANDPDIGEVYQTMYPDEPEDQDLS